MRIVIIGGLGMIGKAVTELAAAKGHELFLLSRSEHGGQKILTNLELRKWDGKNPNQLQALVENTDAVINLAGESIGKGRWTNSRKELMLNSRLEPASALVEALRQCKRPPKSIVQASAVGIYGTGEEPKNELSMIGNDYLAKFASRWEESTLAVEQMGIRRIIIRTGIVLKKGEGVLPQLMLPFKLLVGGPIGSGKQIYSWIHIQDEAAAILHLLEMPQCNGIYNLTAPNPVTYEILAKNMARIMKRPYWLPVPGFVLKLVLGEMSTLVIDGQNILPERLLETGFQFKFPRIEEALSDLLVE